ncbi:MAG: hypothetical protein M1526_06435 [Candidatus Thermoplasmatota archaeon]|jgi:hypothetical protein|nr:hypothetical protein [Candidatus Thermoplasmatota archaeon]MCL5681399.1 hypothetical protein [Candidatus Thermoplasmatota archaeon]
MEIFKVPVSKKKELDVVLSKDPIFRLSITIKDSSVISESGFLYVVVEGLEERIVIARSEFSAISEKISEEEKSKVVAYIEKERENVYSGLGSIFG